MVAIYDLSAYRACRLLEDFSQQAGQVKMSVSTLETNLLPVKNKLIKAKKDLEHARKILKQSKQFCEATQKRNKKCLKVLEQGDIEELIKVRDELGKFSTVVLKQ